MLDVQALSRGWVRFALPFRPPTIDIGIMTGSDKSKDGDFVRGTKAMLAGEYVRPPRTAFDPNKDELFGGIAGLTLPVGRYEVAPNLVLSQTFAHVILPAVMAFAPRISREHRIPGHGQR